jgi:hypothetical protein
MPIQAGFGSGSLRSFGLSSVTKRRFGSNVAVQYLVVAGGGGSTWSTPGTSGAGGAGGLQTGTQNTVGAARLFIQIGAGGTGWSNGTNSSVTSVEGVWSNVTADGGGAGGYHIGSDNYTANTGGSGGGGTGTRRTIFISGYSQPGAVGYSPQGNAGGNGFGGPGGSSGGGGGGAGGAGGNASETPGTVYGGAAGASFASSITGTSVNYSGGGAGAATPSGGAPASVQGTASSPGASIESNASDNGGGGAGGIRDTAPAGISYSGGSGVVVLRSIARASNTVGSPTETKVGNEWIYTFIGSGEIVLGSS